MRSVPIRVSAPFLLFLSLVSLPRGQAAADSNPSDNRSAWVAPGNLGTFVHKLVASQAVCLEAGVEQARRIRDRDPDLPLTPLVPESDSQNRPGLRIILRGTAQLKSYPSAVEGFKRAAARWESLIQNHLTIIIDVDFGPTLFGKPFDDDVVGSTDAQVLAGNSLYPAVREGLIARALTPENKSFLNSLPAGAVPTDGGRSTGIAASSATLRALELINQMVDPYAEASSFGLPPAVGLNSKFKFDFDSSDEIASDSLDFDAIVLHDIGHVLGFISSVGQSEIDSSPGVGPSVWDLFRFRPDAIRSDLTAAQRILFSGGEQSFYAGDAALPFSTGRPDGTGGDGRQASHWKDDNLTGKHIGVMDPTLAPGERVLITFDDTAALDAMGYRTNSVIDPPTVVPLVPGQPQRGGMTAPPVDVGVLSHLQYSIDVPAGAAQLRIDLNGDQDVDLFVRFGQRVFIQGFHPESDYVSASESGSETIIISPSSSPPLRQGTYFIAVANFGPGDADFTVTATVTGGENSHAPAIFNIGTRLEGDVLDLSYRAVDIDGDFVRAEVNILDEAGRAVGGPSIFSIDSGNSARIDSSLSIGGLSSIPTALRASLVLIDSNGNRSTEAIGDFGRAEAGGPTVISANYNGMRLTIRTEGLAESIEVEINGLVVAPPRGIKIKGSGSKLIVKGDAAELGLRHGANRVRVKNLGAWSNILVFSS